MKNGCAGGIFIKSSEFFRRVLSIVLILGVYGPAAVVDDAEDMYDVDVPTTGGEKGGNDGAVVVVSPASSVSAAFFVLGFVGLEDVIVVVIFAVDGVADSPSVLVLVLFVFVWLPVVVEEEVGGVAAVS